MSKNKGPKTNQSEESYHRNNNFKINCNYRKNDLLKVTNDIDLLLEEIKSPNNQKRILPETADVHIIKKGYLISKIEL